MVVPAFGLDRLDDQGGDVVRVVREGLLHLVEGLLLRRANVAFHLGGDRAAIRRGSVRIALEGILDRLT